MIGSLLWNHWFWITLFTALASRCYCDSLLIQPYDVPAPSLQSFGTDDLVREEGQGETDDAVEPFITSDGGRNVMVSKSVSFSRVSVEIGGVRVAKKIADSGVKFQTNETSDNDNANIQSNNSVKPQSFFQKLISQLKSIAAVKSGETGEDSNPIESNPESIAKEEYSSLFSDGEEYQIVYRDEDYVDDDQYVIDDYLNYNYNYADGISDAYSDIIDISDYMQGDYQDAQNDFIDYNDNTEGDQNGKFAPVIDNHSNEPFDPLVTVNHEPDLVRPSLVSSRSDQARGRSLILQEADIRRLSEEIFEASDDVLKSEHIVLVKDTEEILHDINAEDNLKTDLIIEPTLNLNIKIGIFIGVALGVLIITVVAVLVMRQKVRSAKLVIDEDESTTDSQFAFSRGLKNNSSVMQEHLNNNFGKSSYTCDDLHSLDNDSFLTSLETISVKDKFTWD